MISVLILTKNEESNLPRCLDALNWCDDIVVFDSFSNDRTVEIARAAGARIFQRTFDNYSAQREAARATVMYRHAWVLAVDADEVVDSVLVSEMKQIAGTNSNQIFAYRMRRKDMFMGRWIKHATLYPSWFVRFYRPDRVHYEPRRVHEYPTVNGEIGEMRGHLIHYNFSKGLEQWVDRHNRYSTLESLENLRISHDSKLDVSGIFSITNPVRRRRALKELSMQLPFRPLLRFVYMYFLRLGLLDGIPGFHYCRLLAIYEYLIVLKMKEVRRREQGLSI